MAAQPVLPGLLPSVPVREQHVERRQPHDGPPSGVSERVRAARAREHRRLSRTRPRGPSFPDLRRGRTQKGRVSGARGTRRGFSPWPRVSESPRPHVAAPGSQGRKPGWSHSSRYRGPGEPPPRRTPPRPKARVLRSTTLTVTVTTVIVTTTVPFTRGPGSPAGGLAGPRRARLRPHSAEAGDSQVPPRGRVSGVQG